MNQHSLLQKVAAFGLILPAISIVLVGIVFCRKIAVNNIFQGKRSLNYWTKMAAAIWLTAIAEGLYWDVIFWLLNGDRHHKMFSLAWTISSLAAVTVLIPFFIAMTYFSDFLTRTFPHFFKPV